MTEENKEEKNQEEVEEIKEESKKDESGQIKEKEIEVPKKFKSIVEEIEKMTVLDLAELVKILEKKFGVSAAAPVTVASAPVSSEGAEAKEEKSVFNIELTGVGEKKIEVIKVVRDVVDKGLKEAKDLVDAVASGAQMVKENVKKEEAEEIKKKFEAAGGTVELK
jgi:large subunit ribosomal protein L7/L12